MQMTAPPPGSDAERPPSPSSGTGMPKFSLLGQQLHYGSPLPGQQAPQPQPQVQGQSQQQHHDQNQAQQQQQQGRSGLGFSLGSNPLQQQHLHQLLPFQGQGQGRGHQGQHGYQQGLPFGLGHGYSVQQEMLEADAGAGFVGRGDLMSTLGIIHQGIGQVQALLPLMAPGGPPNSALAHQQAATAQRLAAVISQLAMAAAAMLPAAQQHAMQQPPQPSEQQRSNRFGAGSSYGLYQQPGGSILGSLPSAMGSGLLGGGYGSSPNVLGGGNLPGQQQPQQAQPPHVGNQGGALVVNTPRNSIAGSSMSSVVPATVTSAAAVAMGPDLLTGGPQVPAVADHSAGVMSRTVDDDPGSGSRDEDDDVDGDNLPPGSYDLIEMEAVEILAEHTHFCEICGKGFKRDANLRMHMRGHGDEYKTPAALARPDRSGQEPVTVRPRRYSCPCVGCKRNKKHRKFQPLKTMLCVKNHYRRSHCPKSLTCTKCKTKRFSVMADLKTHEKHCGRDKWQCSCGTTFSRKDKLLGHIGLFQGHTPAVPLQEMEESGMDGSSVYSSGNGGNGGLGTVVGAGYSSTAGTPSSTPNDPQPARGLMQSSSMLHGLFTSNFLQGPSSTN